MGLLHENTNILKRLILVMYRLRRNDVISYEINDVTHFVRNDVMFALMCPQAHIISVSGIVGVANIICPKGKHH